MVIPSFAEVPVGKPHSNVILVESYRDDWIIGKEVCTETRVAFKYAGGNYDCYVTLYQAIRTGEMIHDAWILLLDPSMKPLGSRLPQVHDFGFAHDVCCGLGGFASALQHLGGHVVTAVDWSPLAIEAFALNHHAKYICSAIGDMSTTHSMHTAQHQQGVQPVMFAGYPCQPYSSQGEGRGGLDSRSHTLPEILTCGWLLQVSAFVLECVPATLHDPFVQRVFSDFATKTGFRVVHKVLDLHHVWPSRRSRCFIHSFGSSLL